MTGVLPEPSSLKELRYWILSGWMNAGRGRLAAAMLHCAERTQLCLMLLPKHEFSSRHRAIPTLLAVNQ